MIISQAQQTITEQTNCHIQLYHSCSIKFTIVIKDFEYLDKCIATVILMLTILCIICKHGNCSIIIIMVYDYNGFKAVNLKSLVRFPVQ